MNIIIDRAITLTQHFQEHIDADMEILAVKHSSTKKHDPDKKHV